MWASASPALVPVSNDASMCEKFLGTTILSSNQVCANLVDTPINGVVFIGVGPNTPQMLQHTP
jgi:hypothetical protein